MSPDLQQLTVAEQREAIQMLNLKTLRKLNPHLANDPEFQQEVKPAEIPCPNCGGPVLVSPGQIVYACGKRCKKILKRMMIRRDKGRYGDMSM